MHQQPPKTPLFASTRAANGSQLDSSRALIVYPDPTSTQPSPRRPATPAAAAGVNRTTSRRHPMPTPVTATPTPGRTGPPWTAEGTVYFYGGPFSNFAPTPGL